MGFVRDVGASVVLLGTLGTAAFAQAPARLSVAAQKHHRMAVEYFNKAQKDTTLTADQKRDAVLQGIAAENALWQSIRTTSLPSCTRTSFCACGPSKPRRERNGRS
jgi:hypothetical protein